jgi:hypothetical protein
VLTSPITKLYVSAVSNKNVQQVVADVTSIEMWISYLVQGGVA